MHIDQTPFERAADAWNAEVNAEAARLLDCGEASDPLDAQRRAQVNVRQRRAAAAGGNDLSGVLTKVLRDQGGPL